MSVSNWPQDRRPQDRLLTRGVSGLSDAELLSICLGKGSKHMSVAELSESLIEHFGSLREVLRASSGDLRARPGMGPARAAELTAVAEIGRRVMAQEIQRGDIIANPEAVHRYLLSELRDLGHEVFAILLLDSRHQIIRFESLFRGTIDGASVHPREVVLCVLGARAAAVVLVHNHPSGVAEPSRADVNITARLKSALELVDVRLLDHLIVGDMSVTSMAERGLL